MVTELCFGWKSNKKRVDVEGDLPAVPAINRPEDITDCKLYVPVVTLQEKYENELYKNLKTGISFDFEWGKYRT